MSKGELVRLTAAGQQHSRDKTETNRRAAADAKKKYDDGADKAVRTTRAIIDNMAPAQKAAVQKAGTALASATDSWQKAEQEYLDALVHR